MILWSTFKVPLATGNWDAWFNVVSNPSLYFGTLLNSEPFMTQAILNETIVRNTSQPAWEIFIPLLALFPFAGAIAGRAQFNEHVQTELFSYAQYGLASNMMGEFYSYLGIIGIFLFQFMMIIFCMRGMRVFTQFRLMRVTFFSIICAHTLFYIYRNELLTYINFIRNIVILWLVAEGMKQVLLKVSRKYRKM